MKRVIHIVSPANWCEHSSVIFKRHSQLNIFTINEHQTASFMHKFINNQSHPYFNMYIKQNGQVHDHDTRKNNNIHIIAPLCTYYALIYY